MPCSANDFSARTFFIGHHVRVAGCCQEGQGQVLLLDVRRSGKYRKGLRPPDSINTVNLSMYV